VGDRKAKAPPQGVEPLLGAEAIAAWLDCSVGTVYRYVRTERLPHIPMGRGRVKFLRSEVDAWLRARRTVVVPGGEGASHPAPARPAGATAEPSDWRREMRRIAGRKPK
jgi:excisionase family DNA binding protein